MKALSGDVRDTKIDLTSDRAKRILAQIAAVLSGRKPEFGPASEDETVVKVSANLRSEEGES